MNTYKEWPGSLTAERQRQNHVEKPTAEKLKEEWEALPEQVRRQIDAADIRTDLAQSDYNTERGRRTIGAKITTPGTNSSMDRLNRELVQAAKDMAESEPGSRAYQQAEKKIAQLEQSAQFQRFVDEAETVKAEEAEASRIENMEADLEAVTEAHERLTVNSRRARYGLPPLGS